jgi:flagellar protein FlaG
MSNDISTNRLPPAAVNSPAPAEKPAEKPRAPQIDTSPALEEPKADPQEKRRTLEHATEQLNQQMRRNNRDLSFSVDDVADKVVVTVKNRDSGEVVRQIPSEVALRVAHNLEDMKGLMQDGKS